ncbi:MAG TPA: HTH domain-containing protein [Polyangia bacterium]
MTDRTRFKKSSTDRVVRIIQLLEHIRSLRFATTAPILAEKFEVSVRQIYRDLDTLRFAGVAIEATRGSKGGISLGKP